MITGFLFNNNWSSNWSSRRKENFLSSAILFYRDPFPPHDEITLFFGQASQLKFQRLVLFIYTNTMHAKRTARSVSQGLELELRRMKWGMVEDQDERTK